MWPKPDREGLQSFSPKQTPHHPRQPLAVKMKNRIENLVNEKQLKLMALRAWSIKNTWWINLVGHCGNQIVADVHLDLMTKEGFLYRSENLKDEKCPIMTSMHHKYTQRQWQPQIIPTHTQWSPGRHRSPPWPRQERTWGHEGGRRLGERTPWQSRLLCIRTPPPGGQKVLVVSNWWNNLKSTDLTRASNTWLSAARKLTPATLVSISFTFGSINFHWLTSRERRRRLAGLAQIANVDFFHRVPMFSSENANVDWDQMFFVRTYLVLPFAGNCKTRENICIRISCQMLLIRKLWYDQLLSVT